MEKTAPLAGILLSMLFISVLIFSSCSKKESVANTNARIICAVGTVSLTGSSGEKKASIQGSPVMEGDTLCTDAVSFAVIQIGERGIVRVEEHSQLQIEKLLAQSSTALFLKEGKLSSKVSRLAKDESYKIRTPVSVAAVRGTEFAVATGGGHNDVIAVKDGKVALVSASVDTTKSVQEEVVLESGNAADVVSTLR